MQERIIRPLEELDQIAGEILSSLPPKDTANVLALSGELGAGKTAFVQALAKRLGVREQVVSPTFLIMRAYATENADMPTLIHIDAYRIEDARELEVLKIPQLLRQRGTLVCIEWPERIESSVPDDALRIRLELRPDGSRSISY